MPVPAIVKATLIFQTGSFGWTESFLWAVLSNDLNLQNASLQVIAQKRAALLGAQSFIKAQRVSFESDQDGNAVAGDSFLAYNRYNGAQTPTSDDPDTAVLVTMRNLVAQHRRNMFLRGIWDDVNGQGGFYLPSVAGWQSAFNSWAAAMLARQAGWWHNTKSAPKVVSNYVMASPSGYVTVTMELDAFGAGPYVKQVVRFQGINVTSPINGTQLVTPISATECVLEKPLALLPYTGGGVMFTYTRSIDVASTIDAQKIVTRRAGAPLLQSRGRRRGRVRA